MDSVASASRTADPGCNSAVDSTVRSLGSCESSDTASKPGMGSGSSDSCSVGNFAAAVDVADAAAVGDSRGVGCSGCCYSCTGVAAGAGNEEDSCRSATGISATDSRDSSHRYHLLEPGNADFWIVRQMIFFLPIFIYSFLRNICIFNYVWGWKLLCRFSESN